MKRKLKKRKKTNIKKQEKLICDKCGFENEPNVDECANCKGKRFAPQWIVAKRPINRQVSVDITKSNPKFGQSLERITLSKWWPGDKVNFNVPNLQQWESIQTIINEDLGPRIGWKSKGKQIKHLKKSLELGTNIEETLQELANQHPDLFTKFIYALDPKKLPEGDINSLFKTLTNIAEALKKGGSNFREAFLEVLRKLPEQRPRAIEQLEELLHKWSLQQVTSVAQTVMARLDTLELFKYQIQDDRTFEIKGDTSIHRILEKAMWMINEHYWLLASNSTLREFIGKEMTKKDKKKYGGKRPDFVCGSVGQRLIIAEIKRPSKTLNIEDLNQLEDYLTIAQDYTSEYRTFEAYLIGNKKGQDLKRRMNFRSSNFNVLTYTDLVDKTEKRYREYLELIK